jgi:predicted Zn-dependent peptidase
VTYDAAPRLMMAFRKPAPPSKEDAIFDVLELLLSEGNTGRLRQRLVFKDRLAQGVGVFTGPGVRLDNLFIISVTPMAGVKPEQLEAAIWDELQKLASEPPSARELEKVRNRVTADLARSLETNVGLANALSRAELLLGGWRYVIELPKVIETLTPEEIQATAKKFFTKENSLVVTLAKPGVKP